MPDPQKLESLSDVESLLLVEGPNDRHAVFQLMRLVYAADPVFDIQDCGGDERVLDEFASKLVDQGTKHKILGLILDSDTEGVNADQVIQSRCDQLRARTGPFYSLPDAFPETGLILTPLDTRPEAGRLPKLGVWLMPNNRAHGMFEDLLMEAMADEVRTYTAQVVNRAKADGIAKFKESHLSKAVIRTYMAWQDPPDIQYLGLAIQRKTFENIETQCKQFIQWLADLFGAPK